jgi:hypothetical protein
MIFDNEECPQTRGRALFYLRGLGVLARVPLLHPVHPVYLVNILEQENGQD